MRMLGRSEDRRGFFTLLGMLKSGCGANLGRGIIVTRFRVLLYWGHWGPFLLTCVIACVVRVTCNTLI